MFAIEKTGFFSMVKAQTGLFSFTGVRNSKKLIANIFLKLHSNIENWIALAKIKYIAQMG